MENAIWHFAQSLKTVQPALYWIVVAAVLNVETWKVRSATWTRAIIFTGNVGTTSSAGWMLRKQGLGKSLNPSVCASLKRASADLKGKPTRTSVTSTRLMLRKGISA